MSSPRQLRHHIGVHWKKYAIGSLVGGFLTSYFTKKLRERNVIREYCNVAKKYGEEKTGMLDRPKRLLVFLNGYASNLDAKSKFTKYVAPLLHLSGMDVTVVESQHRGHLKELMEYVDPSLDGIVIAGGDGTILEVLNGLRERKDAEKLKSIPVGLLPLGTENNSFTTHFPSLAGISQARMFGEASLKIIQGLTQQVPTMSLQPEKGRSLCALSAVEWGAFERSWRNRNRFKLFGKLRLLMSRISTALRHWPEGCGFTLCMSPASSSLPTRDQVVDTRLSIQPDMSGNDSSDWLSVVESADLPGWTKWSYKDVAGIRIRPSVSNGSLSVHLCPDSSITKSSFITSGWQHRAHGSLSWCEGQQEETQQVVLVPHFPEGWLSIDGEEYELLAMTVALKFDDLTLFM